MTSTDQMGVETTAPAAGPRAPRFAFPVIDRVVGAQESRVLGCDALTPTIVRLRLERPSGYEFRASQHALLGLSTKQGPDLRPLSLAGGSAALPGAVFYVTGPATMGGVQATLRKIGVKSGRMRSVSQGYR